MLQVRTAALEVVTSVRWSVMHPQWRSAAKVKITDKPPEPKPTDKQSSQTLPAARSSDAGGAPRPRPLPSRVVEEEEKDPSQVAFPSLPPHPAVQSS